MLEDIARLTGTQVVAEELDIDLNEWDVDNLGSAEKIVITKDSTTIVGGAGDKKAVEDRIAEIEFESQTVLQIMTKKN